LDQPAGEIDEPGCPRSDDRHPGRPAAWADRRATTRRRRSIDLEDQFDGFATVNAESGCLKGVDTARIVSSSSRWWVPAGNGSGDKGSQFGRAESRPSHRPYVSLTGSRFLSGGAALGVSCRNCVIIS
jgi:hypothetical protein